MQNQKEEINIESKGLKTLLSLIPELTLTPDGILLKQTKLSYQTNCNIEL